MTAVLSIEYKTVWGENLVMVSRDVRYPMTWGEGGIWSVVIPRATKSLLADYTYIVVRDGLIVRTEWDHHHSVPAESIRDSWIDCPVNGCPFPRKHDFALFDRPGFRAAGTAIPVFSLRSENGFGVGEFKDIRLLVDWAVATGQTILQVLPVNDTTRTGTWLDSYPYNPISTFALHPLYMNLQDLGIRFSPSDSKLRKELNDLRQVDYERVMSAKERLMRRQFSKSGKSDLESAACRKFLKMNSFWLDDYAAYRSRHDGSSPVEYYCWQQFHLDRQLSEVSQYAREKGVALKGDLPIGVSRDSVDAHTHPELFNLDTQTVAPPDFFSEDGQNWGFPTYNWKAMADEGYVWWKARLRKMSEYFSAFRIDHILGFFRIWEIPSQFRTGVMGHFNPALPYRSSEIEGLGLPFEGLFIADPHENDSWHPMISPSKAAMDSLTDEQRCRYHKLYEDFFYHRHNGFWKRTALTRLPELLGATGMLACGEDLGMIPACVPEVMDSQRILSFEMQRMPKAYGVEWDNPGRYPYLSVCSTSSHDMSSLRVWWENEMDSESRRRYFREMLHRDDEVPQLADPELVLHIIWQHLESPSMLAVIPFQDWTSIDSEVRSAHPEEERVNVPANPRNYWRYRMHVTLEKLNSLSSFNSMIAEMVKRSGRSV